MEAHRTPYCTVDDYDQWDGAWELHDGVPVMMSPSPGRGHQECLAEVYTHLREQLKANDQCRCRAYFELDWRKAPNSVLRPDVFVVCPKLDTDFLERTPELIVEVLSPSTRYRDEHVKREVYAQRGVRHYVLVDPDDGAVVALTRDEDGSYAEAQPADGGGFAFDLGDGCEVALPAVVKVE